MTPSMNFKLALALCLSDYDRESLREWGEHVFRTFWCIRRRSYVPRGSGRLRLQHGRITRWTGYLHQHPLRKVLNRFVRQIIKAAPMQKFLAASLMGLLLAASGSSIVSAGALEDGYAAYNSGDYPAALQLFWKNASQGNAEAQYNMGFLYENGRGPATDYREAFRWYQLSAAQGYAAAQTRLGYLYESGCGVSKDDKEAIKWFRLAAAQGYAEAKQALARGQRAP
jgi:hypothetical protein